MTYDPRRNLLFLHIPKNAGKSVEAALGLVEPRDLKNYRFRSPLSRVGTFLQRRCADQKAAVRLFGTLDYTFCAQHLTLQEIELLGLIPKEKLASAIRIAVCRNPWDRAVSTFSHFSGKVSSSDRQLRFTKFWEEWLEKPPRDHNVLAHRRTQIEFLRSTSGERRVDSLLRFETLSSDIEQLAEFGIRTLSLPHIGASKDRTAGYRDYYDAHSRELISRLFQADIDAFGYEF